MEDALLRELLHQASEVLSTPQFRDWHDAFVSAHCDAFEIGDESALECNEIHRKYETEAETKLEAALTGSSLRDLCDAIAGLGARTPRDLLADHDAAQSIDKLVSLTDYSTFKEVMLVAKAELHGARGRALAGQVGVDVSAGEDVQQVAAEGLIPSWDDALFASLPELIEPPSAANDWVRTLELPELISERKVTAEGALLMRVTFMAPDLEVDTAAAMMVDWTNERTQWDGMLKASCVHSEVRDESGLITDLIYTQTMKIPFLAKLGGIPSDFDMRIRSRRDWPEPRAVSWALTPWDLQTGEVDRTNRFMTGGVGVAKSAPSGHGSVVTLFEKNSVKWIPSFLMNRMIKGQVLGNLQRYREYLRRREEEAAS